MQELYREFYGDFTVKHSHKQLAKPQCYKLGYTMTRPSLRGDGSGQQDQARRPASQEARATVSAGHAFVPGRLDPSLDCGA